MQLNLQSRCLVSGEFDSKQREKEMISTHKRKVTEIRLTGVRVTQSHIEDGKCGLRNQCMARVAMEAYLRALDPTHYNHHTKVDAGHISFHYQGHRYVGDTPKEVKGALTQYDKEKKARDRAKKNGVPFESKVKPFAFTMVAERRSKIVRFTAERQAQINEARRRRIAAGKPEKRYTLRERIVGFA